MTQIDLLTGEPVPAPRDPNALTDRQQLALEFIGQHQPVTSDELGAFLCERRGKHDRDTRCEWDTSNGRSVGDALKAKGLVVRRRGAGWCLPSYRPGDHLPSAQNAEGIPF